MQFGTNVAVMNSSAYALQLGPLGFSAEHLMPPQQQQQDVGAVAQLTGHLAGWLFPGLVSLSKSYLKPENSFTNDVKGLSHVEPFRSLSAAEEERLRLLKGLERGWDGGAAEAVKEESIEAARDLLLSLKSAHPAAQDARVLPIADGRIQLEWHDANRSLEFEFTHPGWIALGLDRSDSNE